MESERSEAEESPARDRRGLGYTGKLADKDEEEKAAVVVSSVRSAAAIVSAGPR